MVQLTKQRRALLLAALGFVQFPPQTSALLALHAWLDNWRGVGLNIDGMMRQGYRVSVRNIAVDNGWVATFSRDPMTSNDGFGSAETPWAAVQQAAWMALRRVSATELP